MKIRNFLPVLLVAALPYFAKAQSSVDTYVNNVMSELNKSRIGMEKAKKLSLKRPGVDSNLVFTVLAYTDWENDTANTSKLFNSEGYNFAVLDTSKNQAYIDAVKHNKGYYIDINSSGTASSVADVIINGHPVSVKPISRQSYGQNNRLVGTENSGYRTYGIDGKEHSNTFNSASGIYFIIQNTNQNQPAVVKKQVLKK